MSEFDELRRRIDRLEARAEIGALATAYALALGGSGTLD